MHASRLIATRGSGRWSPGLGLGVRIDWARVLKRWVLSVLAICFVSSLTHAGARAVTLAQQSSTIAQAPPSLAPLSQGTPPPPSGATVSQPITVQAGTGVLLRLPQPAATVMSAEPNVARVQPASPSSLFLMGVAPGRTTVIATTGAGTAIVQYDVTVTPGAIGAMPGGVPAAPAGVSAATARAIQANIGGTVQGAGAVRVRAAGNEVIVTGTVPNAAAAQQAEAIARAYLGEKANVIDQLTVLGSIQVNVRVRVAEIDRQITRQLGINWQALGTIGSIGKLPAATLNLPGTVAGTTNAVASAACASGLALSVQCQGINFNGIIDALAQDQLATILAEPNLTVLSGDTASFLAGGEFPVPVAGNGNNGSTTITVEYKAFGVSLAIIPTVLSPSRLNLRVRPEVSQLSQTGAINIPISGGTLTIPALTVRRAETTVELGSGQSFAIAGLLQRTSVNADNALPGLGEVPVLGALFKSNAFQRGDSELVIIVTPFIVQPASSPQALRAPTDHFRPATDLDRILFGRQVAPTTGEGVDAGFILK